MALHVSGIRSTLKLFLCRSMLSSRLVDLNLPDVPLSRGGSNHKVKCLLDCSGDWKRPDGKWWKSRGDWKRSTLFFYFQPRPRQSRRIKWLYLYFSVTHLNMIHNFNSSPITSFVFMPAVVCQRRARLFLFWKGRLRSTQTSFWLWELKFINISTTDSKNILTQLSKCVTFSVLTPPIVFYQISEHSHIFMRSLVAEHVDVLDACPNTADVLLLLDNIITWKRRNELVKMFYFKNAAVVASQQSSRSKPTDAVKQRSQTLL